MKQKQEKVRGPFKCHYSFGAKESIWEYELDQNGKMINMKETVIN
jgi:hypothetical protein